MFWTWMYAFGCRNLFEMGAGLLATSVSTLALDRSSPEDGMLQVFRSRIHLYEELKGTSTGLWVMNNCVPPWYE